MPRASHSPASRALATFRRSGGTLRTTQAIAAGIHPRTLCQLCKSGRVDRISRGVYRLASAKWTGDPDLVVVAMRIPRGILCLTSALAIHELTTQIPRVIEVALPPGGWTPAIRHPPIRVYRFSQACMHEGVETRVVDGTSIRLFNAAKTVADCFKFRNKIGTDIAAEALRTYLARRKRDLPALAKYAKTNRVESVMRPYLAAILA